MNILVIGASGRVGNKLTKSLLQDGHQVTGTTRKDEKLFGASNYSQIKLKLTAGLEEIESSIQDETDAIYFVSGSGGEDLLQVDLHGAIKTMKAAENKNISRYIMLSAIFSLQPGKWKKIINYYIAKHYADLWLINETNLDYTILQPGLLTEEKGSGNIDVNVDEADDSSIENVANTLKVILDNPNTFKKSISIHDGDTPIADAVSNC